MGVPVALFALVRTAEYGLVVAHLRRLILAASITNDWVSSGRITVITPGKAVQSHSASNSTARNSRSRVRNNQTFCGKYPLRPVSIGKRHRVLPMRDLVLAAQLDVVSDEVLQGPTQMNAFDTGGGST